MFDLQLELCEKLVHFPQNLEYESAVLHFQSIIIDKTPCLFTKKITQSDRWNFLCIVEEYEGRLP